MCKSDLILFVRLLYEYNTWRPRHLYHAYDLSVTIDNYLSWKLVAKLIAAKFQKYLWWRKKTHAVEQEVILMNNNFYLGS